MNPYIRDIFDVIKEVVHVLLKLGSLAGLVSLIFIIKKQVEKRPKFKFDFHGSRGTVTARDGMHFYDVEFIGHVKNQSTEQNSITTVFYVMWKNNSRTMTLTNGMNAQVFDPDDNDKNIPLPILFKAKQGKHLRIKFSICVTGTGVGPLIAELEPVLPGSNVMVQKNKITLAFVDTNEIMFDERGHIRSKKLFDLWWTLPNTFSPLGSGNPIPYAKHMLRILVAYIHFKGRSLMIAVGL